MNDFRVVPASTGMVVQCARCGWYAPLYGGEAVEVWEEHDRDGCYSAEGAHGSDDADPA